MLLFLKQKNTSMSSHTSLWLLVMEASNIIKLQRRKTYSHTTAGDDLCFTARHSKSANGIYRSN